MAKPHIVKLLYSDRWVCSMRNTNMGLGITPQEAFRDWRRQNLPSWKLQHRIDLGRYAGTYGGTLPDRAMTAHDTWWLSVWEARKRLIIGGLVAAAVLWLLWG